jgi:hypothetical protein
VDNIRLIRVPRLNVPDVFNVKAGVLREARRILRVLPSST